MKDLTCNVETHGCRNFHSTSMEFFFLQVPNLQGKDEGFVELDVWQKPLEVHPLNELRYVVFGRRRLGRRDGCRMVFLKGKVKFFKL